MRSIRSDLAPVLALLAVLSAVPAAGAGDGEASTGGEVDTQTRIQTVADGVEIELRSSEPFPVRALPPVLRIGEHEIRHSRRADDGRLDTLIFLVSRDEFEALEDGADVTVFYALGVEGDDTEGLGRRHVPEAGGEVWDFGPFHKDLLDRDAVR